MKGLIANMKDRNHNETSMIMAIDNVFWLTIRRVIKEKSDPAELALTDIMGQLDGELVFLYEVLYAMEDDIEYEMS